MWASITEKKTAGRNLTGCILFRWWDVSATWDQAPLNGAAKTIVLNYLIFSSFFKKKITSIRKLLPVFLFSLDRRADLIDQDLP